MQERTKGKRISSVMSLTLALCMILSTVPVGAWAESDVEEAPTAATESADQGEEEISQPAGDPLKAEQTAPAETQEPAEEQEKKPADDPAEAPEEEPAEEPAEEPVDAPAEGPEKDPAVDPAQAPEKDPAEESDGEETPAQLPEDVPEAQVKAPKHASTDSGGAAEDVSLTVELNSGAVYQDGEAVWTATSNAENHIVTYRVSYALSGEGTLEPEAIRLTIPKTIFTDRDGNSGDRFDIAFPHESDIAPDDDSTVYVYKVEGDQIVVYNRLATEVAGGRTFRMSYTTQVAASRFVDGSKTAAPEVTIQVPGSSGVIERSASGDAVTVDTEANLTYLRMQEPSLYQYWNHTWGATPADANNYNYLIWAVESWVSNGTQPYRIDLNGVFDAEGCEIIGYRFENQTEFGAQSYAEEQTQSYRVDYILMRISKEKYPLSTSDLGSSAGASDTLVAEYHLPMTVAVTVTPMDSDVSNRTVKNTWNCYIDEGKVPEGSFFLWHWSREEKGNSESRTVTGRYSSYALLNLTEGDEDITNLRFELMGESVTGLWGLDETPGRKWLAETDHFGEIPVTLYMENQNFALRAAQGGDRLELGAGDYEINSVSFDLRTYDIANTTNYLGYTLGYGMDRPDQPNILRFYAKFGAGDYAEVASVNVLTKEWTVAVSDAVQSASGSQVSFASGCTGFRAAFTGTYPYIQLYLKPVVTLKNNEKTAAFAGSADNSWIALESNSTAWMTRTENGQEQDIYDVIYPFNREDYFAKDYITTDRKTSAMSMQTISVKNDKVNEQFDVTWQTQMRETRVNSSNTGVRQESGTFYILLPVDSSVDPSKVQVYAGGTKLNNGAYTVRVTENYKGSQCPLLTVQIDEATNSAYSVTYTTTHSWNSLEQWGETLHSTAAYETGNDSIAGGNPDNGGSVRDAELMAGLDGGITEERFLYAQTDKLVEILTSGATGGLSKQVRSTGKLAASALVHQDQSYVYQITTKNDEDTTTKDLIFIDCLESYQLGQWRGSLVSVGVRQLRERGIDAKIYYSTQEDLDIESLGVSDTYEFKAPVWMTPDQVSDLSAVTAVAVDARKTTSGSDFVLQPEQSLSVSLYMRAPEKVDSTAVRQYAYNGVYLSQTNVLMNGTYEDNTMVYQGKTTAEYRTVGTLTLKKVDSTDSETPVKGITFTLTGASYYGTVYDGTSVETNSDGIATFEDLERGTYTITETKGVPDYLVDTASYTVVVDTDGNVTVAGLRKTESGFLFPNDPRVHGDLVFRKVSTAAGGVVPDGAVFCLYGTSAYGNDYYDEATSSGGTVTFENVELGDDYTLTELSAPDGFFLSENTWKVVCNERGSFTITGDDVSKVNGVFTIANEPEHGFTLHKTDLDTNEPLTGAQFKLTGVTDAGEAFESETVTSVDGGRVEFTGLPSGVFTLKEITPPENHVLDENGYVVVITRDDQITIDGLTYNQEFNYYEFPNEQEFNNDLTVTVYWEGDEEVADQRPTPELVLTTNIERMGLRTASFDWYTYSGAWGTFRRDAGRGSWKSFQRTSERFTRAEMDAKAAAGEVYRVDDLTTDYAIYAWVDSDHNVYWWSDATDAVYLTQGANSWNGMFQDCYNLETVDLRGLNWGKIESTAYFFYNCNWLKTLLWEPHELSNSHNLTTMRSMFYQCYYGIEQIDLRGFDTSSVTSFDSMFERCYNLRTVNMDGLNTSNVHSWTNMFWECSKLEGFDFDQVDTSAGTKFFGMLAYCPLTDNGGVMDLRSFETDSAVNLADMFRGSGLTGVIWGNNDFSNVEVTSRMFQNCYSLKSVDMSGLNAPKLQYSSYMFDGCNTMTEVKLYDTEGTDLVMTEGMFRSCRSLTTIESPRSWNFEGVDSANMFQGCTALQGGNGTVYNAGHTDLTYAVIDGENGQPGYFTAATAPASSPNPAPAAQSSPTAGANAPAAAPEDEPETVQRTYRSEPDGWTDNGDNTWTYTFKVYDEHMTYYLYEEKLDHYTSDAYRGTYKTIHGEDVPDGEPVTATVTNTYLPGGNPNPDPNPDPTPTEPDLGILSITKTVEPAAGETLTAEDTQRKFIFTVTLTAEDDDSADAKASVTGAHVFGETAFRDGVGKVAVANGETVYLTDLPAGLSYTVTEAETEGYELTASQGASGEIAKNNVSEVAFTNTKDATVVQETNGFTLTKQVEGPATQGETFTFNVVLTGLNGSETYHYSIGNAETAFTANAAGAANVTLTLANGESADFDALPVGAGYRISESASDYVASYTVANAASEGAVARASGANRSTGVALSTAMETVDIGEKVTVTFTNTDTRKTLTVSKTVDGDLGDRNKAFAFTLNLTDVTGDPLTGAFAAEGVQDSVTLDENGNASFTLSHGEHLTVLGLPDGAIYTVSEDEDSAEDYLTTVTVGNDSEEESSTASGILTERAEVSFTNTYVLSLTDIRVVKHWNDGNGEDRPENVTVTLTVNGEKTDRKLILSAENDWAGAFTDLPMVDGEGHKVTYGVAETAIDGYRSSVKKTGDDTFTVTNTMLTELTVEKIWNDEDDVDGIRPDSVTVRLLQNGTEVENAEVTEAEGWKHTFTELDKYDEDGEAYVYTVTEDRVGGYTAEIDGTTITNTHIPSIVNVTVEKVWHDGENANRPATVTVTLTADGKATDHTLTLSAENGWAGEFADLPMKGENGNEIVYGVEESEVTGYRSAVEKADAYTFTVTNTLLTELTVEKVWADDNDRDGIRPDSVTVRLMQNGKAVATADITEADGWKHTFTDLDQYDGDGEAYIYTVTEDKVEGYTAVIDGLTVTNTHVPDTVSISVNKVWHDRNNTSRRPDSITVTLTIDGAKTDRTLTLSAEGGWTGRFTDLPKHGEDGHEIVYGVEESSVAGYRSSVKQKGAYSFTITNTATGSGTPDTPKTGDEGRLRLWMTLFVMALGMLTAAAVRRKHKQN